MDSHTMHSTERWTEISQLHSYAVMQRSLAPRKA